MPKPDPVTAVCASCGAQKPVNQLGRYDDTERAFCLQREGRGGLCWKERTIARPVPPPTSIEALVCATRGRYTPKGTPHAHA